MGNKRERKRKFDRTRHDALHNEKKRIKYHEKKKQTSTNIEDTTNDDVIRYLDHNVDDMNVQNQIQEEIELGM